jgi:hypothetical protein
MQARAANILSQSNVAYHDVLSLHERAKKAQDVIKLNCVNNKLVQVKAQLNIADNENQDLQVAIANHTEARFDAFAALQNTGSSIQQMRQDARTCIGEVELYKQESGVTVTHPPFPDQPAPIDPFQGQVEPPAYASPFI